MTGNLPIHLFLIKKHHTAQIDMMTVQPVKSDKITLVLKT